MTHLTSTRISANIFVDSVNDAEMEHVVDNNVVDLERPMGRKADKAKRKALTIPVKDIVKISRMKYTFLEKSCNRERVFPF